MHKNSPCHRLAKLQPFHEVSGPASWSAASRPANHFSSIFSASPARTEPRFPHASPVDYSVIRDLYYTCRVCPCITRRETHHNVTMTNPGTGKPVQHENTLGLPRESLSGPTPYPPAPVLHPSQVLCLSIDGSSSMLCFQIGCFPTFADKTFHRTRTGIWTAGVGPVAPLLLIPLTWRIHSCCPSSSLPPYRLIRFWALPCSSLNLVVTLIIVLPPPLGQTKQGEASYKTAPYPSSHTWIHPPLTYPLSPLSLLSPQTLGQVHSFA